MAFYVGRAAGWGGSALIVETQALARRPGVIHFQAPINRRLGREASPGGTPRRAGRLDGPRRPPRSTAPHADDARFAAIYRAADLVLVHSAAAADELHKVAGVEAHVVDHVAPEPVVHADRAEARQRLDLPARGPHPGRARLRPPLQALRAAGRLWEHLGERAPTAARARRGDRTRASGPRSSGSSGPGGRLVRPAYADDEELQLAVLASDAVVLPYETASESGLLHQARRSASRCSPPKRRQLATSVQVTGAGRVVPGDVDAWSAAVTGPASGRRPRLRPPRRRPGTRTSRPTSSPGSDADEGSRAHAHAHDAAAARERRTGAQLPPPARARPAGTGRSRCSLSATARHRSEGRGDSGRALQAGRAGGSRRLVAPSATGGSRPRCSRAPRSTAASSTRRGRTGPVRPGSKRSPSTRSCAESLYMYPYLPAEVPSTVVLDTLNAEVSQVRAMASVLGRSPRGLAARLQLRAGRTLRGGGVAERRPGDRGLGGGARATSRSSRPARSTWCRTASTARRSRPRTRSPPTRGCSSSGAWTTAPTWTRSST